MAWPKSGCIARNPTTTTASKNENNLPGGPFKSRLAAINQAATTMKPGFKNSDGCTEAKPKENHRTAPLPKSVPNIGNRISATKDTAKPAE